MTQFVADQITKFKKVRFSFNFEKIIEIFEIEI